MYSASDQIISRVFGDAKEYHITFSEIADRHYPIAAEAPFAYRIGTPFVVSVVNPIVKAITPRWLDALIDHWAGRDDVSTFYVVNIAAALLLSILLLDYLRLFIESPLLRLLLLSLWLIEWHAPARWVYFNPVNVEPLFLVCALAGLYTIEERRHDTEWHAVTLLVPLSLLGTLCRESMVLLPIAFIASRRPWALLLERRWKSIGIVMLPLVAAVLAVAWTRYIVAPTNHFDALAEPLRMLRTKPADSWLLACFFTYGPAAIALIAASARTVRQFLASRPEMVVWLAGVSVLAFIGGTDTERLLGWAAPVFYVLLGLAIVEHRQTLRIPAVAVALIAIQLVSARVFWPVPGGFDDSAAITTDFSWQSVRGLADRIFVIDHFYANLFSFFGSRSLHIVTLIADVMLVGAIVVLMRRRRAVL